MTEPQRIARFERVLYLRDKLKSKWRSIGTELGVGAARARQIYEEAAARRSLGPDHPLHHMSGKARNILFDHGIESPEAAKAAFEDGRLHPLRYKSTGWRGHYEVTGWRGLGPKTFGQIAAWAGFELPPKPKKKVRRCPHCGKKL